MQFHSLYFILYFLPAVMLGWYLLNKKSGKAADVFLLAASFLFYFAGGRYLPLFLASLILVNWALCLAMRKRPGKKMPLVLGICVNAGLLLYFKYTNFFLENLNTLLKTDHALRNIVLPLGISFIAFTQISFLVDSYRQETKDVSFLDFALYSAFFPKITQGPITRQKDLIPQLQDQKSRIFDADGVAAGLQMFTLGLAKKVFLADTFGNYLTTFFELKGSSNSLEAAVAILAYSLQIYFDFSGYSDMALGAAKMLGFDLPANFNSPYKADSVTDFWRRWHISLTDFLREYIYFPLGGSRKGTARTYVNILIVFLVSGFWHGANWTFIVWGIVHGLLQVFERANRKWYFKIPRPVRQVLMFVAVSILWMVFRCDTFSDFAHVMRLLFSGTWQGGLRPELADTLSIPGLRSVLSVLHLPYTDYGAQLLSVALILGFSLFLVFVPENAEKRRYRTTAGSLLLTLALFAASILSLSSVSSFIYNNF